MSVGVREVWWGGRFLAQRECADWEGLPPHRVVRPSRCPRGGEEEGGMGCRCKGLWYWRVPGRSLVGCLSGCAVRVTQPLRLIDSGYVQTVLPELDPGTRAAGRSWSRRAVAGHRPGFPLRCRWLTLCESPCFVRRVVWVRCPGQAPGTQVPKPPRCTTRAANRNYFKLAFRLEIPELEMSVIVLLDLLEVIMERRLSLLLELLVLKHHHLHFQILVLL